MRPFFRILMTTFLLAFSSNVSFAARESVPPFGSQTADWIVPIVFIAIVVFLIWKSVGGGRGDGSSSGDHWDGGGNAD